MQPEFQLEELELDIEVGKAKEPILVKYIKRHHAPDQIIGDKIEGTMIRGKSKGTCFLADFEPRNVESALNNDSWIGEIKEEIEQIEKNKT